MMPTWGPTTVTFSAQVRQVLARREANRCAALGEGCRSGTGATCSVCWESDASTSGSVCVCNGGFYDSDGSTANLDQTCVGEA